MRDELCKRVHYLSLGSNKDVAAFRQGSPFVLLKMDLKKMFCCAGNKKKRQKKNEMSLIMGTFLSLHCEP